MALDPFGLCGQVIEAQFRIDRAVGEGGFSVVYRAHHLGLDEPVAIKCLKLQAHLESDMIQEFAARFRDESRIMYKLSQGNLDIVRSMTSGTTVAPLTGALIPYMVLEWLEGKSLGADLRERRVQNLKGRTLAEVIELFEPAANAVAFAHEQGVVHRDLKPGNLYLSKTATGIRLKVLDFGLAKIVDPTGGIIPSFQTTGNNTICSPSYGAPEQFDPSVGKIGPWTDVYALGLLVLELLRDKKVRKGEGLAKCALEALSPEQPTATSLGLKLRPQLELALARAVAFDPGTRQRSAREFWADITRGAAKGKSVTTVEVALDGATVLDPSLWSEDLKATRVRGDEPMPPATQRSDAPISLDGTLVLSESPVKAPSAAASAAASTAAGGGQPPTLTSKHENKPVTLPMGPAFVPRAATTVPLPVTDQHPVAPARPPVSADQPSLSPAGRSNFRWLVTVILLAIVLIIVATAFAARLAAQSRRSQPQARAQ
jgi:serine/threonine-protein kinase